jgi:hypothetical protein
VASQNFTLKRLKTIMRHSSIIHEEDPWNVTLWATQGANVLMWGPPDVDVMMVQNIRAYMLKQAALITPYTKLNMLLYSVIQKTTSRPIFLMVNLRL